MLDRHLSGGDHDSRTVDPCAADRSILLVGGAGRCGFAVNEDFGVRSRLGYSCCGRLLAEESERFAVVLRVVELV